MPYIKYLRLFLLVFLLAFSISTQGQQTFKFFLYVTDAQDKPVDNIDIEITNELSGEVLVNRAIEYLPYSFELNSGKYILTVRKYGYFAKSDTLSLTSDLPLITLKLQNNITETMIGSGLAKPSVVIPGIVNVIDRQQIEDINPMDLIELLRTIPGFDFAHDVENNIGLAYRGIWTMEGKYLIMLNGVQMNDALYGSFSWVNRFPIDNIERIEIIKGPAAVFANGGLASQGSINIITRTASDAEGIKINSNMGTSANSLTRQNFSLLFNKKYGSDFFINASVYAVNSRFSDARHYSYDSANYDMTNESTISNKQLYLGGGFKNLRFNIVLDGYTNSTRAPYGAPLYRSYPIQYPVNWIDLYTQLKLTKNITFIPKIGYGAQRPYSCKVKVDDSDVLYFGSETPFDAITATRLMSSNRLNYKPLRNLSFDFLLELNKEDFVHDNKPYSFNNSYVFSYRNIVTSGGFDWAILGISKLNSKQQALNLNVTVRNDNQTFFSAFTPQAGLTFLNKKFYAKFLLARAFKSPLMKNIVANAANQFNKISNLQPEFTNSLDFEIGFTPSKNVNINVNLYQQKITNTIVYRSGIYDVDDYYNSNKTGTEGIELNAKWRSNYFSYYGSFSFYRTNTADTIFQVNYEKVNLGIPPMKTNHNFAFNIDKITGTSNNIQLVVGLLWNSERDYLKNASTLELSHLKNELFLNSSIKINDISQKKLNLSIGINNILDNRRIYVQPYYGSHSPIPGFGREFFVKLNYLLDFD